MARRLRARLDLTPAKRGLEAAFDGIRAVAATLDLHAGTGAGDALRGDAEAALREVLARHARTRNLHAVREGGR